MRLADRRTKIVATIGPATSEKEQLRLAVQSGMNVARLNFSHGEHAIHRKVIQYIREVSDELQAPVAILQDLQGPKIRVGKMQDGGLPLKEGERVVVSPKFSLGQNGQIPTDFMELPQVCQPGTRILLDDGLLELKVISIAGDEVICEVIFGGLLKNRKGMNLPGVALPVDCMTAKDLKDLEFGLSEGVDYVALSFVRRGSDIKKLRELVMETRPQTRIVAKIEMLEALEHLEEIIALSDAVMVARGDLAVEVGQSQLPGMQKRIIKMCNNMDCPVITATQMLDSMVENPRPTRAEITDVANAVIDGSDALMLSAETASGKYPYKCIQTMSEIIFEVERSSTSYYNISIENQFLEIAEAIGASACLTALNLNASTIVCLTSTGKTATFISSFRPKARIIAITHVLETLNRLELVWGIQTFSINPYRSTDEAMAQIEEILLKYGLVEHGEHVVLTLGVPVLQRAKTNSLRVYRVGGSNIEVMPNDLLPFRCRQLP